MLVAVRVSSLSFYVQPLGSRSSSHGRSPKQLPRQRLAAIAILLLVSFLVRPQDRFFVPTCAGAEGA